LEECFKNSQPSIIDAHYGSSSKVDWLNLVQAKCCSCRLSEENDPGMAWRHVVTDLGRTPLASRWRWRCRIATCYLKSLGLCMSSWVSAPVIDGISRQMCSTLRIWHSICYIHINPANLALRSSAFPKGLYNKLQV
jgi:hypothetical protein